MTALKFIGLVVLAGIVLTLVIAVANWPSEARSALQSQLRSIDDICAQNLAAADSPMQRQIVTGGCAQAKKDVEDKLAATP